MKIIGEGGTYSITTNSESSRRETGKPDTRLLSFPRSLGLFGHLKKTQHIQIITELSAADS